jgi:hypothetical protein
MKYLIILLLLAGCVTATTVDTTVTKNYTSRTDFTPSTDEGLGGTGGGN